MKLYVLPIGSRCNARCPYCITRFRKLEDSILDIDVLTDVLNKNKYDRIEITGGGEPSLHPQINKIIDICSRNCPTNIYTNGLYNPKNPDVQVCLSRAHHEDAINEEIMGVHYDMDKYGDQTNLKLSLILHKSGISTLADLEKYFVWARKYAKKVVIRQLFEYEDPGYDRYYAREYVSSPELAEELGQRFPFKIIDGNYFFDLDGLTVEFEGRSCACETTNPVLGADGKLRGGWGDL